MLRPLMLHLLLLLLLQIQLQLIVLLMLLLLLFLFLYISCLGYCLVIHVYFTIIVDYSQNKLLI